MTDSVKIPVIDRSGRLPEYATPGAAGMDVRAMLDSPVTVHPGGRALIPTGLRVELPAGYEMQLRPRSGLALNYGLTIANAPGTVDADYRGEIGVILMNLGDDDFTVRDGERICQMVVTEYSHVKWEEAERLDRTEREDGAFGHTGVS